MMALWAERFASSRNTDKPECVSGAVVRGTTVTNSRRCSCGIGPGAAGTGAAWPADPVLQPAAAWRGGRGASGARCPEGASEAAPPARMRPMSRFMYSSIDSSSPSSLRAMSGAAAAGDLFVREELIRAARMLGIGVSNVIAVLYPELIVLGGDVANDLGPLLIDTVRREVRERVRLFPVDKVRIESSALQEKAGLWGGVALAIARVKQASGQPAAEGI